MHVNNLLLIILQILNLHIDNMIICAGYFTYMYNKFDFKYCFIDQFIYVSYYNINNH